MQLCTRPDTASSRRTHKGYINSLGSAVERNTVDMASVPLRTVSHDGGYVADDISRDGILRAELFDWAVPCAGAKVQLVPTSVFPRLLSLQLILDGT